VRWPGSAYSIIFACIEVVLKGRKRKRSTADPAAKQGSTVLMANIKAEEHAAAAASTAIALSNGGTADLFHNMVPRRAMGCGYNAPVDAVIPASVHNDATLPLHTVTRRKLPS
jgi:glyoxylate carboligase